MSKGHFVWHDLRTHDLEQAKAFYSGLLGWTFQTQDMGGWDYTVAIANDNMFGGLNQIEPGSGEPHWISYISTENLDAATAAIVAKGGTLEEGPIPIPGTGSMTYMRDPWGARVAPFQDENPDNVPPLPQSPPAPGTAAWHELVTPDAAGAIALYAGLTGWQHVEWPMGDDFVYHGLMSGEIPMAGIWEANDGTPSAWTIYFEIPGTMDEAVANLATLGGNMIGDRAVVAGTGEFVVVQDPSGAAFGLFKSEPMN